MSQPHQQESFGDTLLLTSLAYLLVLVPWSFSFAHDFISDNWATIRSTRRCGIFHVLLILAPTPIFLTYVVSQRDASEPDNKEMYTAITALLVGVYHLLRSFQGLYQLGKLQGWNTTTLTLMRQAGYAGGLQRFNDEVQSSKDSSQTGKLTQRWQKVLERVKGKLGRRPPDDKSSISQLVKRMGVNNTMVDNEFTSSKSPNVAFSLGRKSRRLNLFGSQMNPEEAKYATFVRWSVAFLAQFGDKWLKDVSRTSLLEDKLPWTTKKRYGFAQQVLAAATLRMGRTELKTSEDPYAFFLLDMSRQKSYLPLAAWQNVYSRIDDLVFSRERFATKTFQTVSLMPGQTRNSPLSQEENSGNRSTRYNRSIDALEAKSKLYARRERYMGPLIVEASSSLHPILRSYLERHETLSVYHLEWFAAFLWTQNVIQHDPVREGCKTLLRRCMQDGSGDNDSVPIGEESAQDLPDENDIAVRLVRDQLGFVDWIPCRTFFYPFLKQASNRRFWENRAVLEVSCRIDNWLGICSGRHMYDYCRYKPWTSDMFTRAHGERSNRSKQFSVPQSGKIFNHHRMLEHKTLKHQMTRKDANHWQMEQGLTFLGCIVEVVRSELAQQVYLKGSAIENWCPQVSQETVTFAPSKELWDCFSPRKKLEFDTAIQERLLWECQQAVHSALRRKIKQRENDFSRSFEIQQEIEMMLLFIMGFPSIKVIQEPDLCFLIRPVQAPQPFDVCVDFFPHEYSSRKPTARVGIRYRIEEGSRMEVPQSFWWADWRDAFEGRLKGRFDWQRHHFLRTPPLETIERRESMAKLTEPFGGHAEWEKPPLVWLGWKPFRRGFAVFELQHLLSSSETENVVDNEDEGKLVRHQKSAMNTYCKVSPSAISAASLRLDSLLGLRDKIDYLKTILPPQFKAEVGGAQDDIFTNDLMTEAQQYKATALHRLKANLKKEKFSKSRSWNPDLIRQIDEVLLHVERKIEMAESVVEEQLTKSASLPSRDVRQPEIKKARYAVELLWLDVEAMHKKEWKKHARAMTKEELTEWKKSIRDNGNNEYKRRMRGIIDLHMRIVEKNPTGQMLKALADRISKWGNTRDNERYAIRLYESAIIASADPEPMIMLAALHASPSFDKERIKDARLLLDRAMYVADAVPHIQIMENAEVRIKSKKDVEDFLKARWKDDRGIRVLYELLKETNESDGGPYVDEGTTAATPKELLSSEEYRDKDMRNDENV